MTDSIWRRAERATRGGRIIFLVFGVWVVSLASREGSGEARIGFLVLGALVLGFWEQQLIAVFKRRDPESR